eukprot:TRINITY_DN30893_c0_g1_i1.p1 TRINITY_DN30893_c0_g1~~TRINITY_DN30893_c0_g1_i1.p1  ORF type:complete len:370 (+),score=101.93 TRINITY_DN30893_c0_g1_i1:211-1320(+)
MARDLADHILAREDSLDLEDKELARQLEELQARRREKEGKNPSKVATNKAPAVVKADVDAATASGKPRAVKFDGTPSVSGGVKGVSLADEILGRGDENSADRELKAMEEELERGLSEYRKQLRGDKGAAEPVDKWSTTAPKAATASEKESRPAQPSSAGASADAPAILDDGAEKTAVALELQTLMAEADEMDAAFPEAAGTEGDAAAAAAAIAALPSPSAQRRQRLELLEKQLASQPEPPADETTLELKEALDGLEVRLKAVQQRQALHNEMQQADAALSAAKPAAGERIIDDIRAQNEHLRERMKSGSGVWNLDKSRFRGCIAIGASGTSSNSRGGVSTKGVSNDASGCDAGDAVVNSLTRDSAEHSG